MSRRKLCHFWNALFSQLKKLHTSDFITRKTKGQTIISNEQKFENEAFKEGFVFLKIKIKEKFKLKIKVAETKIWKSIL